MQTGLIADMLGMKMSFPLFTHSSLIMLLSLAASFIHTHGFHLTSKTHTHNLGQDVQVQLTMEQRALRAIGHNVSVEKTIGLCKQRLAAEGWDS